MTVGKRIKEIRNKNKLTLRELSKIVDISISFLSDIENGRSNPSLERLKSIAAALDTPVSVLLGEIPNNDKATDYTDDIGPVGFMARGDIDAEELERIINRAVKKALAERERERQRNGEDS
jgi:transcriptional regulator with XRE-family HTH domain